MQFVLFDIVSLWKLGSIYLVHLVQNLISTLNKKHIIVINIFVIHIVLQ